MTDGMRGRAYRNYLLAVLGALLAFNMADGVALGLLLQSIKVDLSLSDTQLGFLTGLAFALFYSVMGIPIARWADRGNRVTVIVITTTLWSIAVALCAMAQSFLQLVTIRIAVAVGEAGCMPTAASLIADHFSREERPRAMARYMLAAPLSGVVGYFLAGWLNQRYGWRTTFMLLGVPGLLLAALAWLTLKEPRTGKSTAAMGGICDTQLVGEFQLSGGDRITVREICATLWRNVTFRHLLLSYAVMTFCGNGTTQWLSAFFIRTYGVGTVQLGIWFALIYGTAGTLGAYWGGELAARYAAGNEGLQIKYTAWMYLLCGALTPLVYLSSSRYLAFSLIWINTLCTGLTVGPLFAVIQTLLPERMRAQAVALLFFFSNLVGVGLGPLAVGGLSDALHPWAGEQSLRYALLALCPTYFWIAFHLWRGSRTAGRDIQVTAERGRPQCGHIGAPTEETRSIPCRQQP